VKDEKIKLLEKRIINLEVINELLQKDNTDLNNISKKQEQIDKKVNAVQTQVDNLEKSHLLQNPLNVLYLN
jgi:DNA-binding transcriptional MerR regulator